MLSSNEVESSKKLKGTSSQPVVEENQEEEEEEENGVDKEENTLQEELTRSTRSSKVPSTPLSQKTKKTTTMTKSKTASVAGVAVASSSTSTPQSRRGIATLQSSSRKESSSRPSTAIPPSPMPSERPQYRDEVIHTMPPHLAGQPIESDLASQDMTVIRKASDANSLAHSTHHNHENTHGDSDEEEEEKEEEEMSTFDTLLLLLPVLVSLITVGTFFMYDSTAGMMAVLLYVVIALLRRFVAFLKRWIFSRLFADQQNHQKSDNSYEYFLYGKTGSRKHPKHH